MFLGVFCGVKEEYTVWTMKKWLEKIKSSFLIKQLTVVVFEMSRFKQDCLSN